MSADMELASVRSRLQIVTPVFEGPLELLLALAEREEVDLLQVSLADLTNDYLRAVAALSSPDAVEMAEFLWTAARLLLLKSIRLLPNEEVGEEEAGLLDWEDDVRRQLAEYREYKEMARELMERAASEPYAFASPARPIELVGQEAALEVDLLVRAFQDVLARIPPRPVTVSGRGWTTAEKIERLISLLMRGPLDLVETLLECEDRLEAVVTFVALLELLREGRVMVRQNESFGAITVEWKRRG